MSLSEIERRWVEFAWTVFHSPEEHLATCPGAQAETGDALDLDPGYVGVNYPSTGGGVVCVGLADGKAESRAQPRRVTPRREVAEEWVTQGRSPSEDPVEAERFLDRWRESFLDDLNRYPWWQKHFDEVVRFAQLRQEDVGVVNLAVCRQRTDGEGVALAKACSTQYPIPGTLDLFRPAALLIAGKDQWIIRETEDLAPVVEHWNAMIPTEGRRDAQNWRVQIAGRVRRALNASPSTGASTAPLHAHAQELEVSSDAGDGGGAAASGHQDRPRAVDAPSLGLGSRFVAGRSPLPGMTRGLVDVVIDLDLLADRTATHQHLVEELSTIVSEAGYATFAESVGPDLLWEQDDIVVVAEVKTLPAEFDRHQLRLGLGQVLEYRAAAADRLGRRVRAVLWVERAPLNAELWLRTCRAAEVQLCWPGGLSPLDTADPQG